MSRAPKPHGDDAAPLYLSFANNALLGALYGEHDRYLARIEQALGVSLASRGNQLRGIQAHGTARFRISAERRIMR